jgi:hypothetical protein
VNKKQSRDFEAFVEAEGDSLLRMAVLLTSNYQLAEDAVQRTSAPSSSSATATTSATRRCPGSSAWRSAR